MKKNKKMNINSKGFTLIELLAVITILGILMLVAIPNVTRTIENSRRDTFADLAKQYVNTVRNAVLADEIKCGDISVGGTGDGYYYFKIDSAAKANYNDSNDLMENSSKSPWSSSDVAGYVAWRKSTNGEKTTTRYSILLVDNGKHGVMGGTSTSPTAIKEEDISRAKVSTNTKVAALNGDVVTTSIASPNSKAATALDDGDSDTSTSSPVACTLK